MLSSWRREPKVCSHWGASPIHNLPILRQHWVTGNTVNQVQSDSISNQEKRGVTIKNEALEVTKPTVIESRGDQKIHRSAAGHSFASFAAVSTPLPPWNAPAGEKPPLKMTQRTFALQMPVDSFVQT